MIGLFRFLAPNTWSVTSKWLMRAALAASWLAVPAASQGQERTDCDTPGSSGDFVFGGPPASVRDQARSIEAFRCVSGYEMFSPDRHGTPASPSPTELGFTLVLRMFRNVCLGIERGDPLDDLMPEGFQAYHSSPYYWGDPDATRQGDTTVLSSTGDMEKDENGGHPAVWLEPGTGGLTCKVQWRVPDEMSTESRQAIASLIVHWLPWALALVPASRPSMVEPAALSDAIEWDRPCQDRWCPAAARYSLSKGDITMQMTLDITNIEGTRP